jgi:glycosyltransferase involved in cell wall biosynthesis
MYCGGCFRDNALVAALRGLGHDALMLPLYLPLTLEEEDQSAGHPLFFSGVNVYLDQKSSWFRRAPGWLRRLLGARGLVKLLSSRAAKTRATEVGGLTVSMLRGEEGNQARDLEELTQWLARHHKPDVICLSNALLVGLARRLKAQLNVPVVCFLTGEDAFLDQLPESHRPSAWQTLADRARDVNLFLAPSRYFGELMSRRAAIPEERVRVLFNGIPLAGFYPAPTLPDPPVLGYFARMCKEKGLDTLVEAFLILKQRGRVPGLRLHAGGSLSRADEPFVKDLEEKLTAQKLGADFRFFPNLTRNGKQQFYRSLSVFAVPARYGEAFGLYLLEAMASGVPVVQPRVAAFPELLDATGGGLLCATAEPVCLAETLERLLLDRPRLEKLGRSAHTAARRTFSIEQMAKTLLAIFEEFVPSAKS